MLLPPSSRNWRRGQQRARLIRPCSVSCVQQCKARTCEGCNGVCECVDLCVIRESMCVHHRKRRHSQDTHNTQTSERTCKLVVISGSDRST